MEKFNVGSIGKVVCDEAGFQIALDKKYLEALIGLENYSHVQIIWWFSESDNEKSRNTLTVQTPYKNAPKKLGVFATRSPRRPNPIAISTSGITFIDQDSAIIGIEFIEAFSGSPVLDIKPYVPSLDRVEQPSVPDYTKHWSKSYEESADFDWENEIK